MIWIGFLTSTLAVAYTVVSPDSGMHPYAPSSRALTLSGNATLS